MRTQLTKENVKGWKTAEISILWRHAYTVSSFNVRTIYFGIPALMCIFFHAFPFLLLDLPRLHFLYK